MDLQQRAAAAGDEGSLRAAAWSGRTTAARGWRAVAAGQGMYYLVTGIWPSISPATFQAVTGPKVEMWLVQLFGFLICVPACLLLWAVWRGRLAGGTVGAAVGTAAVLMVGDVVYVARGHIGPVYLIDALAELFLLAGWAVAIRARARIIGPCDPA